MVKSWKEIYEDKLVSAEEAIKAIKDGDKVVTGFACGEPFGIERALVENYQNYHDIQIISMLTLGDSPWCRPEIKGHITLNCLFASQSNRKAISTGACEFTTSHFYEIPEVIRNYMKPRVAIVMVSPPDEHGYVSFGTTVDYTRETTEYCEVVIAQVNKYMPRTFGNSIKHVRDFTYFVEIDEPLPEVKSVEISETEMKIGKKRMKKIPKILTHIYSKAIIVVGFGIFYFESLPALGNFFKALVGANGGGLIDSKTQLILMNNIWLVIAAVIFSMPVVGKLKEIMSKRQGTYILANSMGIVLNAGLLLLCSLLLVDSTNNVFLYFRF